MALGYPHPDYLLPLLTSEQFAEWAAFYLIEPFGDMHRDDMTVLHMAASANTSGMAQKKDKKPWQPDDFYKKPEELIDATLSYKQPIIQTPDEAFQLLMGLAQNAPHPKQKR